MNKFIAACIATLCVLSLSTLRASNSSTADTIWSDDAVPTGAQSLTGGDNWNWVTSNPAPVSGTAAHQSNLATGLHEHFFNYASTTITPATGEVLFAYVYLDPANLPGEIMLSWNSGTWEHRAYWGANSINYGTDSTVSRHYVGALPAAGQWVRLEVPASAVGLEGQTLTGMGFSEFNGRATWDKTGKGAAAAQIAASTGTDLIWSDDAIPAGAVALTSGDNWNWTNSPTPVSGTVAHQSSLASGLHEHFFNYATTTLKPGVGDVLFAYVYLNPANLPSEIMLSWNAVPPTGSPNSVLGTWEHRAYWGANTITYGNNGTASRQYMGALPAAGQWVRLEVPASQVGVEGMTLIGMGFSEFDGRVTWDKTGKAASASVAASTGGTSSSGSTASSGGSTTTTPVVPVVDTIWSDDAVPAGAQSIAGGDNWNWVTSSPTPVSGTSAHQSALATGLHEHFFNYATATITPAAGEVLFAYVYLDPANLPSEIMLSWNADNWEHRAYWGSNLINYGTDSTVSRHYMGALPAAGQWVRLEVPASAVGLAGQTLTGMGFSEFNGRATWDKTGKASAAGGSGSTVASSGGTTTTGSTSGTTTSSGGTTSGGATTTSSGSTTSTGSTSTSGSTASSGGTTSTGSTSTLTAAAIRAANVDDIALQLPQPGDSLLHVLSPTMLELKLINTKAAGVTQPTTWNFVDANGVMAAPATSKFTVTVNGQAVSVQSVGFKRRVLYAPLVTYDLRLENCLYLQLASAVSDGQSVQVTNPDGTVWSSTTQFAAIADPLRFSPAIHVNQEGYSPTLPKKAMIGYFLGDMGEMSISASAGFAIVDARTGTSVYHGTLALRQDAGYNTTPAPYQKVLMADFSDFTTPGEYLLQVAGLGSSLPFMINDGIAMAFARTYALGLYHQRCGEAEVLPFTRFVHDACHMAPAQVPVQSDSQFGFTWATIASYGSTVNTDNPAQIAPLLTSEASQLYPFVNKGTVDVSGGHHDAGDYSKYTINSAELIHYLMFTVDSIPGVAQLDNLGIPESGDGISDVMQEAKWEADYISKLQDADGGFYFLVYPKNREYESNVMPAPGDPQVVWPKNTSVTAAAVAALAQCASSPQFKQHYPAAASKYLQQAKLGWQFLTNAIAKYGKAGAYQKLTFYSDHYTHDDELAWAACEMYLATGDTQYQTQLFAWFPNPADPATFRWGWWRMSECWGNAIRSYAFAARSGRLPASALNASYLAACEGQVVAAGDDALSWSKNNAYASPFPLATKAVQGAGWYFSLDQASDMAVAYQINQKSDYIDALVGAMNYEGGTNPVNVTYLTGLGQKRQREIVNQYAQNDRRVLPPTGIPLGNIQAGFGYLQNYGTELTRMSYPSDSASNGAFPFYDRWSDTFNVTTEFISVNQARSLLATTLLATKTPATATAWVTPTAQITVPAATAQLNTPVTLTVQVAGQDLSSARIVWEARDQEPAFGSTYTISPKNNGPQWVEVEIEWPDGRRAFGASTFTANSPVVTWIDDALPLGAAPGGDGGDGWNWVNSNPAPTSGILAHQSNLASGLHEHWFTGAGATLEVDSGDTLFAWVYLDPANPPTEVMLMWNDGSSWEHRAFWGADSVTYGSSGTTSRYNAGALPAKGGWVKLSVPAKAVGLEGTVLTGMGFTLFNGRATWDAAGKASASSN